MKWFVKRFNRQRGRLRVRFAQKVNQTLEIPGNPFQVGHLHADTLDNVPLQVPQLRLPGELWLLVCDTLGPLDRRSLAQTCQYFWALINAKAPFLSQSIQESIIINMSPVPLAQRLSFLASAVKVQWSAVRSRSHSVLSSNPLTGDKRISNSILLTLLVSSPLQSLELTRAEVNPYCQDVILRIPMLRKLTLCDTIFVPTTTTLPPSLIRILVLRSHIPEQTAMEHLFRILSPSLETLEIQPVGNLTYVNMIYSVMENTPFRRFTTFRAPRLPLISEANHQFLFHEFITVLHITPTDPQIFPSVLPGTFLPNLRHLSAPWCVAELLIPGRPVQVFCDTELKLSTTRTFKSMLEQLAKSAGNIEELELATHWSCPGIYLHLKKYMPHLKRLRLVVEPQVWYDPREMQVNMDMEPKFGVQYTPLQELELRMEIPLNTRQPHQVSRPNCRLISPLFTLTCPSLKVLSVIVVSHKFHADERDIPLRSIFKLRKMTNGEWEERGFGVDVPQDAKGFPVLDYRS